jgi:dihydrofolate synthase/folylpolyglutamate synthase
MVMKDRPAITSADIAQGARSAIWPARCENITKRWPTPLPSGWEIWLDGAHNPDGARALSQSLQELPALSTHLIAGLKNDKNPADFLSVLLPHCERFYAIPVPTLDDCHAPQTLLSAATPSPSRIDKISENWQVAVQDIIRAHPTAGRIVICGSLYLAGDVLSYCQTCKIQS